MAVRIFSGLSAFLVALTCQAAEIKASGIDTQCDVIKAESICVRVSLTGEIRPGDTQRLKDVIAHAEYSLSAKGLKARASLVLLHSPGGDLLEGMKLGRLIRSRQIGTTVAADSVCASSCVLVLAGGVKRIPSGRVVVHSFYSPALLGTNDFALAEKKYSAASEVVRIYLKEMRISSALLDEMMRIPHFKSHDLSVEQMSQWGLLGLDPVYAQARSTQ